MVEKLDFQHNKIQGVDLETLQASICENYPNGLPVGDAYHHQVIGDVIEMATERGLRPTVTDCFVANNRDRYRPGVTLDTQKAMEYGEEDPRSYIFRRVYCNILLEAMEGDDKHVCAAVSYSQRGVSVAFGAHVHYCRNLMLLGEGHLLSTYGLGIEAQKKELVSPYEIMRQKMAQWFAGYEWNADDIRTTYHRLNETEFNHECYLELLAELMRARICKDSVEDVIHEKEAYPLNSAQINAACERYLIDCARRDSQVKTTFWDVFNIFNYDLKPEHNDLPAIIPQSVRLLEIFFNVYELMKHGKRIMPVGTVD